jgi:hypothetical protein
MSTRTDLAAATESNSTRATGDRPELVFAVAYIRHSYYTYTAVPILSWGEFSCPPSPSAL